MSGVLSEGTTAPEFELPALVGDERRVVSLSEFLGEDVIILAFYPADFNPACDETSCDLDELDLFTMQKDVTILGISPDSVYSHRAFADRYDLNVPLLSDTDHAVAREYGIDVVDDIGQHLIERAVVVIDHDGVVQYFWCTDDMHQLPRVEAVKDAIADTGGDDTAFARYRVGHAHYTEGRRAFTVAMDGFRNAEWMVTQGDFQRACEEFSAAADHFDTAARFVDDASLKPIYEDAKTKATALWQASDWLMEASRAYSSGSGAKGQELRDDAEAPLETARDYEEPPDPDGSWPPQLETLEQNAVDDGPAFLPQEETDAETSLDVDIDAEVEQATDELRETAPAEAESAPEPTPSAATDGPDETDSSELSESSGDGTATGAAADTQSARDAASSTDVTDPPADADDEPVELDLTDPTADNARPDSDMPGDERTEPSEEPDDPDP